MACVEWRFGSTVQGYLPFWTVRTRLQRLHRGDLVDRLESGVEVVAGRSTYRTVVRMDYTP